MITDEQIAALEARLEAAKGLCAALLTQIDFILARYSYTLMKGQVHNES